jgi:hypothetical protein
MYPLGHVAVGILLVRRLQRFSLGRTAVVALLVGTLTPDLLDKGLQWAEVYPWGRTWGHSLVGNLGLAALAVSLWLLARATTLAGTNALRTTAALLACLAVGQWSHLVADLWADLEQGAIDTGYLWSAWLAWPWLTADDLPCRVSPWLPGHHWFMFSEALVVILALRLGLAPRFRPPSATSPADDG